MERRLTEHMLVHHMTTTASEVSGGRSLQEIPLLKGSFGHHSTLIGNSSSQESLYGHQQQQQQQQQQMVISDSVHSLHHNSSIPVTAEIVPVALEQQNNPPAPEGFQNGPPPSGLTSSLSQGAITTSSFMPASAAATLPRSLENGYIVHAGHGHAPAPAQFSAAIDMDSAHAQAHAQAARLQNVSIASHARMTGSPVLVDTHSTHSAHAAAAVRARNSLAMATMPRNMSAAHAPSGMPVNGYNGANGFGSPTMTVNGGTKKKSVTIGTFTTVVEPFDAVNGLSNGTNGTATENPEALASSAV